MIPTNNNNSLLGNNKRPSDLVIRTMEEDLKSSKSSRASAKSAAKNDFSNMPKPPINLPADLSSETSAVKDQLQAKIPFSADSVPAEKLDGSTVSAPNNPVPIVRLQEAISREAEQLRKEKEALEAEIIKKEKEIEARKKSENSEKKNTEPVNKEKAAKFFEKFAPFKTPKDTLNRLSKKELSEINKIKITKNNEESASKKVFPSASPLAEEPEKRKKLLYEEENLSPEARLAKQPSAGAIGSEMDSIKRADAQFLPKSFAAVSSGGNDRPARPLNSTLPMTPPVEEKERTEKPIAAGNGSGLFFWKVIKSVFIILIIAGIGLGVYYFMFGKNTLFVSPFSSPEAVPSDFVAGADSITINADFNLALASEIKKYFSASEAVGASGEKAASAKPDGVYRLVIKDKNGKILKIEDFEKALNINLPSIVSGILDDNYNLIAFNRSKEDYLRLGFAFKVKNGDNIYSAANLWESDIYKNIEPIFLGQAGVYNEKSHFLSNRHEDFAIRYLPLGREDIALNYAISDDKKFLLIAASKKDIFYLIENVIR